jgi:single-strand DNA-binding protein
MKTIGLARLGRDAEVRFTPGGDAVANLSLAVNYGQKDADGNRPTQWIDASLWGKRAESLAPFLVKGSLHCFTLDEIHIETYDGKNGQGHKLVARVADVELGPRAGDAPAGGERATRPTSTGGERQQRQSAPIDDSEDIPF